MTDYAIDPNETEASAAQQPERQLWAAVVNQAITDASSLYMPSVRGIDRNDAITGLRWLWSGDADGVLAALDLDPETVRARLRRKWEVTEGQIERWLRWRR